MTLTGGIPHYPGWVWQHHPQWAHIIPNGAAPTAIGTTTITGTTATGGYKHDTKWVEKHHPHWERLA